MKSRLHPAIFALALFLFAALALAPAAQAELYKYRNDQGEWAYTNDPELIPEDQRPQAESFELQKELPTDAPAQAATAQSDAAAESGDGNGALFSRAVALGAQIVSDHVLTMNSEIGEAVVVEKDTGLIALPQTLAEAEQRARPYLRMILLFLIVVAVGTLAGIFLRRLKRGNIESIAGLPLAQFKGLLFGGSVFAGAALAWLVWYGAQLNWKHELAQLWEVTGGAIARQEGTQIPERMQVELSDGTLAEINGPGELISQHNDLVRLLLAALDKAEEDVEFLEATCSREEGSDNPAETIRRLMKMKQILDEARRKEKDLRKFRRSAARRGFSLGTDPIEANQPRFKDLQERLVQAQKDCMALSMKGHKMKREAMQGVR